MSKHSFVQKIAATALAALLSLSGTVIPLSATATAADASAEIAAETALDACLDFSGGTGTVYTLDAQELLSRAGLSLAPEEAAYLSALGCSLQYSEGLSSALVSTTPQRDTVLVSAKTLTYQAANGTTVCWVPVSLTLDGVSYDLTLSDDAYTLTLTGLDEGALYHATVEYQTVLTISPEILSSWANRAYDDATAALDAQEQYEQSKADYAAGMVKYQNALRDYEERYKVYQAYLKELSAYNADLAEYQEYLKKVVAYDEALKAYNDYLSAAAQYDTDYAAYTQAMAAFQTQQQAYDTYLSYLSSIQAVTKRLTTLNTVFVKDSAGRTMYATLMGDTVATVMANKETLINAAGASRADIENAGASTDILQELLTEYRALTDVSDQFAWYKEHYTTLRDRFILLYSSLDNLGNNRAVQIKLNQEGKWERYAQFVGQLYIISTGLDDAVTFDDSWTFAKAFHIYDVIEECQRVVDDNMASPANISVPEKMEAVEKPIAPTAPQKPTAVSQPVKTWTEEVTEPTNKPAAVSRPREPRLDDYVTPLPAEPVISSQLQPMVDLVAAGQLTERPAFTEALTLTFASDIDINFSTADQLLVTFYDHDGKKILYSTQVFQGDSASYGGQTPQRSADAANTYTFAGWVDQNGQEARLSNIRQDTKVYASYTATLRSYTVTWTVAGNKTEQTYLYGETPTFQAVQMYEDAEYRYYFAQWSPAISKVTGNAEYTAQYTKQAFSDMYYSVRFEVADQVYLQSVTHGQLPDPSAYEEDYIADGYRYTFAGWSPALGQTYADTTYTAVFDKTILLPAGEQGNSVAQLVVTSTAHTVTTDQTTVDTSYAVSEAIRLGTQLVVDFGGAKVTIGNTALKEMPTAAQFSLTRQANARSGNALPTWVLSITDQQGNPLTFTSEILLELPLGDADTNGGRLHAFIGDARCDVSIHGSTASLRVTQTGTVSFRPYYTVSLAPAGEGFLHYDVLSDADVFYAGDAVALDIQVNAHWALSSLTISIRGGAAAPLKLENGAFIMPEGDVQIHAEATELEYTIVFMVNGVAISTEKYHYGDAVTEPNMSDQLVVTEGDTTHTFAGWNSELSRVTGDKVYTAVYEIGTVGNKDNTYVSPNNSDKLFTIVLPILICLLLLGGAILAAWLICRKKGISLLSLLKRGWDFCGFSKKIDFLKKLCRKLLHF